MQKEDLIRLLPDSVANQIAAGEVIQRPASVVKELVENSIDAGATAVEVIVKDAGRTLIQIVDNGIGMSPTDARMAFERHATSKISKADDLFTLSTMGFRGEALPSIAAVATVDLRTMRHGDEIGTRLLLAQSKFEDQYPEACVPGTNIMVKNLFSFIPARRRFLKKDNVELGHIIAEFERLALVNPGVDFKLINNDLTVHQLRGSTLRGRITDLFGPSIGDQLWDIKAETPIVNISGFITPPALARKRGAKQFFFVNGRNMKHPFFHKLVLQAYDKMISFDCQPSYFINLTIDPSKIDVNIHPQKHEIKFSEEQAVGQILSAALRASLGRENTIIFDVEDAPDIPVFAPVSNAPAPVSATNTSYNPFEQSAIRRTETKGWEQMFSPSNPMEGVKSRLNQLKSPKMPEEVPVLSQSEYDLGNASKLMPAPGAVCLNSKYIIAPSVHGLLVIDRYRAHLTIIFNRLLSEAESGKTPACQALCFPEIVELTVAQHVQLEDIAPRLLDFGFDLSYLGTTSWAVNGLPALGMELPPKQLLLDLLDEYASTGTLPDDSLIRRVALSVARATAIKAGERMNQAQIDRLLSDLFSLPDFGLTPDGRKLISLIPLQDIERLLL